MEDHGLTPRQLENSSPTQSWVQCKRNY